MRDCDVLFHLFYVLFSPRQIMPEMDDKNEQIVAIFDVFERFVRIYEIFPRFYLYIDVFCDIFECFQIVLTVF